MFRKSFLCLAILGILAAPAFAQPGFTVVPLGLQSGNWVWQADISPDFLLAGGSTPVAVEMGFRLTGSPLVSASIINPSEFDTPIPGNVIFGWEALTDLDPGPGMNLKPVGLQTNPSTSEVFAAYGSIVFSPPNPKPFLKITALGPANGGGNFSTIQWLGAYNLGMGRIAQGLIGPPFAANFDIYSGASTQVPEPAGIALCALGTITASLGLSRRRNRK